MFNYALYDIKNKLIYVGVTSDLITRLDNHKSASKWWKRVSKIYYSMLDLKTEAQQFEIYLINKLSPEFCKLYNNHEEVSKNKFDDDFEALTWTDLVYYEKTKYSKKIKQDISLDVLYSFFTRNSVNIEKVDFSIDNEDINIYIKYNKMGTFLQKVFMDSYRVFCPELNNLGCRFYTSNDSYNIKLTLDYLYKNNNLIEPLKINKNGFKKLLTLQNKYSIINV